MNRNAYTYGLKPQAVTQEGSTTYAYDNNGNLVTWGSQTLTWDAENRLSSVSSGDSYVYDGQTTIYANKYFEKKTNNGEVTIHY